LKKKRDDQQTRRAEKPMDEQVEHPSQYAIKASVAGEEALSTHIRM
jgi:hypothetical protein